MLNLLSDQVSAQTWEQQLLQVPRAPRRLTPRLQVPAAASPGSLTFPTAQSSREALLEPFASRASIQARSRSSRVVNKQLVMVCSKNEAVLLAPLGHLLSFSFPSLGRQFTLTLPKFLALARWRSLLLAAGASGAGEVVR